MLRNCDRVWNVLEVRRCHTGTARASHPPTHAVGRATRQQPTQKRSGGGRCRTERACRWGRGTCGWRLADRRSSSGCLRCAPPPSPLQVLNVLQALVDKSGIVAELEADDGAKCVVRCWRQLCVGGRESTCRSPLHGSRGSLIRCDAALPEDPVVCVRAG